MLMRRIRFWLESAKRRRALQEEMELHIAEKADEFREQGMSDAQARAEARRRFGNVTLKVEDARDVWSFVRLDLFLRDLRYALRMLSRNPGFTAAIVLTLAVGIGANAAIFSIVDHVLLRSLPYPDADRLVMVYETHAGKAGQTAVTTANWLDWQKESHSFESIASWGAGEFSWQMNLLGDGPAERLNGQFVSQEFFSLVGVQPALGRAFEPGHHMPGSPFVVILSHGLWQRRFSGDPNVIGRKIMLEAVSAEVIGVMPPRFHFVWDRTDFWAPGRVNRNRDYRANPGNYLNVVGRLKPSVTADAAQTELDAISARLAASHSSNKGVSAKIVPLREELTGVVKTSLWVLFAAVGVLMLIACSNFASLLVARSAYRRPEMTLRASLGAGHGAIVRQCLAESLMLALLGGVAGVAVARGAIDLMIALVPPDLMQIGIVPLDGRVLLYTLGLSVFTGIIFGLAPALTVSRVSLINALHTGTRATPQAARLRHGLVVAEVGLTVMLLCASGLLARSFRELTRANLGLDPRGVLTLNVGLDGDPYDARKAEYVAFYQQTIERIQSLPGVRSAAAAGNIPVTTGVLGAETTFRVQGEAPVTAAEQPAINIRMVTPGYFRTLGVPLLGGRDFSNDDRRDSPLVFVVNQALVDVYLSSRDPLSTSISIGGNASNPYGRIIGVTGNVTDGSIRGRPQPTVFFTYSQIANSTDMIVFVKADNPAGLVQAAAREIQEIDPNVPVSEVRLLEAVFGESIARDRLNAAVSGAFALSALLLSAFGIYGLLSFQVAERTREIGIRMALGARSSEVLTKIVCHSLRLVIPGVLLGVAGAVFVTRWIESLLYGIRPRDPFTFGAVIALIIATATLAAFVPARRAARVDPLTALR